MTILFAALIAAVAASADAKTAANLVTGVVYDNRNNPLTDVDVELLSDLGSFLQHTRTDSAGRYSFFRIADGRYSVRVTPFKYDFQPMTRELVFSSFSLTGAPGSTTEIVDFYLLPKRDGIAAAESRVVFAQEVPESALKAFDRARAAQKSNNTALQLAELQAAVKLFPVYFDALFALGEYFLIRRDFGKSANYFLRAADVNANSPRSFYFLGYSLYSLGMNAAALAALERAMILSPASIQTLLLVSSAEIADKRYLDAEKHLLRVKKLSSPPNPEVHWQLSRLYAIHFNKFKEAADELESYIDALPKATTPEELKKLEDYRTILKRLRAKQKAEEKP